MVWTEFRQILGTASSSKANAIIASKDVDDFPIDPQLPIPSERITEMTSVATKSGPSISTKEMTSDVDIRKGVAHLGEEESENSIYLIRIVAGTSDDSESLMAETPETEHAYILDSLEGLHQTSGDSRPLHCSAELLMDNFSRVNVIRNDTVTDVGQEKFEELAGTWVATGNSRDMPSRFMFYYPNEVLGYDYNTPRFQKMGEHMRRCETSQRNSVKPLILNAERGATKCLETKTTRINVSETVNSSLNSTILVAPMGNSIRKSRTGATIKLENMTPIRTSI
jgi:hypothetical protein